MSSENAASLDEGCETSSSSSSSSKADPLRLVLLGRTGSGRSSSGNTLLGRPAFWVEVSPSSITTRCRRQSGSAGGRSVSVVDTPGFFHTHLSPQEVLAEVGQCVTLYPPGPHVFLVTLKLGRFTQEEKETLELIRVRFGLDVSRFTMVLFTWGDRLRGKGADDFLQESRELSEFVSSCRGGYHVFHNSGQDETANCSQQVTELLNKADQLVAVNGGGCYSNEMYKEAESILREAQERILENRSHRSESPHEDAKDKEEKGADSERRRRRREEEEEARRREERLFWCELVTALGRGAAEGAGIIGKDRGKAVKKVKVVEKAAALAASPLCIKSAVKVVGGAVREGSKVLSKHKNTLLR